MALNRLGEELTDTLTKRPPPPVTVPALSCLEVPVVDDAAERREIADKFAEYRTIAKGRDAWAALARTERETFDKWRLVSAALYCGRNHALRVSGADAPNGARYTKALTDWLTKNFGDRPMPKATRYWCCRLHEHLSDIEQWLATVPAGKREKLINPLSVCRAWLRATNANGKGHDDPVKAATVALARFCALTKALPADQAAPLWATAQAQAAEALCR